MRSVIPKNTKLIPKESRLVFKGSTFDVYQWEQQMFDGSSATFEMLKRPDTTKVIAIKDGKIVVLHEEQPGFPKFFDVPGGRHDVEGETELEAAKREMLEETGMTFKNWRLVDATQPNNKIDWLVYTFLATDLQSEVAPSSEAAGEKIDIKLMTLQEAKKLKDNPATRSLPKQITESSSIEELATWPEFKA